MNPVLLWNLWYLLQIRHHFLFRQLNLHLRWTPYLLVVCLVVLTQHMKRLFFSKKIKNIVSYSDNIGRSSK